MCLIRLSSKGHERTNEDISGHSGPARRVEMNIVGSTTGEIRRLHQQPNAGEIPCSGRQDLKQVYPQERAMARRNVGILLGTCRSPPCCSRSFPHEIVAYLERENECSC